MERASGGQSTSSGSSSHRCVRVLLAAIAAFALLLSLSAKLFVWPAQNALQGARADAIVVLGGPGPRWQVAVKLANERAAPIMLVSVASTRWNCPRTVLAGVRIECFRPDPFSTMGEARYVASQAREHGWHSLIVVSSTPQATRARLRVKRCFDGSIYVVAARPRLLDWPAEVIYEWGALIKALVWQTAC